MRIKKTARELVAYKKWLAGESFVLGKRVKRLERNIFVDSRDVLCRLHPAGASVRVVGLRRPLITYSG
jgi:hypothetical protein